MVLIQLMGDIITNPLFYSIWWLLLSWIIWSLVKLTPWSRPTLPTMLIYSISVAIEFTKSRRQLEACLMIDICAPDFSLVWFVLDVAFWFIILYALMKWISRIERAEDR